MRMHGALVGEQGMTFGIVVVPRSALTSTSERDHTLVAAQGLFPGVAWPLWPRTGLKTRVRRALHLRSLLPRRTSLPRRLRRTDRTKT